MTSAAPDILQVPAHEVGVVRIFAMATANPSLAAILPPHPIDAGHLAPLLGAKTLRDGDVERIAIHDLGDYTLSEFLRIGHDIRSSDLAPVAADLDALNGHVLLVHSTAFAGSAIRLSPASGLLPIAALRRNDAPPTPLSLPETERPEILTPETTAPRGYGRGRLALVIAAALLLIILVERLMT